MKKNARALNVAIWVGIAIIAILTLIWGVWAARQPEVGSLWAPH